MSHWTQPHFAHNIAAMDTSHGPPVTVRSAEPSDYAAIAACVIAAYTPYIAELGVTPAPLSDDYAAHLAHQRIWVAESGAELVGLIVLIVEPMDLLVETIAVAPAWQNRGVSRVLFAIADQVARASARHRLRLYTHKKMTRNVALYRRRGWRETERRPEHHPDRVYMERTLPDEA